MLLNRFFRLKIAFKKKFLLAYHYLPLPIK